VRPRTLVAALRERRALAHAEAVLLVHDHEPERVELQIAFQERVRAEEERRLPQRHRHEEPGPLLLRRSGREKGVGHPLRRQKLRRRGRVLLRQDRGGSKERGLPPRGRGAHRGRERDHRLPRSDVAEEEAPHRLCRVEIAGDRGERTDLRAGQAEWEREDERPHRRRAGTERRRHQPVAVAAARVLKRNLKPQQFLERQAPARRLRLLRRLGKMDAADRAVERREPQSAPPSLGEHVGHLRKSVERVADPGPDPPLAHPLGQRIAGREARHVELVASLGRLEFGVVEFGPAEDLDRPGEEVALPHAEFVGHVRLVEPDGPQESSGVAQRGDEVGAPAAAPARLQARDDGFDGSFHARLNPGDRGDDTPVAIARGQVVEKVSDRDDPQPLQAAGHLGTDAFQETNGVVEGGHRLDAREAGTSSQSREVLPNSVNNWVNSDLNRSSSHVKASEVIEKSMEFTELRRLVIVALFSDDELAKRFVLKGGNALELVYELVVRGSVDVDLSIDDEFDDLDAISNRVFRSLRKVLGASGFVVFDEFFRPVPVVDGEDLTPWWGGYRLEFKLIESSHPAVLSDSLEKMRINSKTIDERHNRIFRVDVSKHEYCEGKVQAQFGGIVIYVYSEEMCVVEKFRAICQQMPEYGMRNTRPRARDFYDIYTTITKLGIDLALPENLRLFRSIFAAKRVPLKLLALVAATHEFHRPDWDSVRDAAEGEVLAFDFYFDFVVDELKKLESLWDEEPPPILID